MAITTYDVTTHIGLVLSLGRYEDMGYDTISIAIVWNWDKMAPQEIVYGNTRGLALAQGAAYVDANPYVLEFYNNYMEHRYYEQRLKELQHDTLYVKEVGCTCLVARGRTAKGKVVTITAIYTNDSYNRGLVRDADGKTYEVYMKNLEIIAVLYDPDTHIRLLQPPKLVLNALEKEVYSIGEG